MARRRGNKKRRDVARDSTGFRRAAKIGILAAGIAAGGYKIISSELGQRAIKSGLLDEALKTGKNLKKDLLNKPKNLYSLRDAYNKNIGKNGEVFKRNLRNRKVTKATETTLGKKYLSIKQTRDNALRKMKADEYENLRKRFKEAIVENFSGEQAARVGDIVDALFDKATEENVKNKTILSHYKKAKKSGLNDAQLDSLLSSMVKFKEENPIGNDIVLEKYTKLADQIVAERNKKLAEDKGLSFMDRVINRATGTRALTLGDLKDFKDLDLGEGINIKFETNKFDPIHINEDLRELGLNDKYKDVVVDRGLRVFTDKDGNKILSDQREIYNTIQGLMDKAADTLPGKILLKNVDMGNKHGFGVLHTGKRDVNAYLTGATDNIMQDAMVYFDGILYGLKREGDGAPTLDFDNMTEVREVTSWRKKVVQELLGTNQFPLEAYDNFAAKILDINQDGSYNVKNQLQRIFDGPLASKLGFETDPTWEKNQLKNLKNYMNGNELLQTIESKSTMYDNALTTSAILNRNITGVSDQLMDRLIQSDRFSDNEVKILNNLLDGSADSINEALYSLGLDMEGDNISNDKLRQIISKIYRDVEGAQDINHISIKEGRVNPLFGTGIDEQWERNELGQLRVEYVKELLLRKDESEVMNIIQSTSANETQYNTLRDIGLLGLFEKNMNLEGPIAGNIGSRFEETGAENLFRQRLQNNTTLLNAFNDVMDEAIKDFSPLNRGYMGGINETGLYSEYNDITLIRRSAFNPREIIKNINDLIKSQDVNDLESLGMNALDTAKGLGREILLGGRYDTEHITEATLLAQYSMSRLNYSLAEFGLGLSADSMSSPLNTYLNFGLKRVLPVALGIGTFSYLNDESRRFLGSSIIEAGARGLSYVDIGARKFAYNIGLGNQIDKWAETSVIHEYYFGDNHFNTAEEQRDWYENGYSPVRKGRYWSFGSSSEYRGGAISYWQPNYLRRAESNYHDVSVYGSSEEKWAHSWIPTPTHPFSTLRAALNPYWLEKKHLKEGDRPYPLTSKLFTEGTPWGAVLNPTVGEILKPVRMLPEARLRLGHNGRDSKAVIKRINERIKAKEQYNDDLLIVSGTDIRNAEYVPFGNPVSGEMNFTVRNGQIMSPGYDFMDEVPDAGTYTPPTGDDYVQTTRGGGRVLINENNAVIDPNIMTGMTNQGENTSAERIGRGIISQINNAIKNHRQSSKTRTTGVMNDSSNSTYVYRNLVNEYNNYIDNWYGDRVDPTLVNKSLAYDFTRDAMYSASQISGIYGYLGSMFTGSDNSYTFRYESAEQMNSFSRTFWDASIGGLGGGPMEIARRFFPSEQRNRINVNPLINNMPDWIPDSYKTGDPYTNIPKGEARLPGKGYETLNELHPDQFGDYGAFDRYKILADVAPNSREYKIWRNIAKNTVTDPELQKEMKDIAERTAKMSGNHEFFEYTYLKNTTEYSDGIVKGISGSNIYLTDNTVLSLAGIDSTSISDGVLNEFLQPGQKITYRHNKDKGYSKEDRDKNFTTASVVYLPGSSESVNKALIDSGAAEKDVEDNSTIAKLGRISGGQEAMGALQELVAHAHIPIVHNKFLRVDTAYESYMKENYYGSNFKTWDHPIKGFVKPMFNEQSSKSLVSEAWALGVAYRHFTKGIYETDFKKKWISNIALATTNPTAFLFGNISYILHMGIGGSGRGQEWNNWQRGAALGTVLGTTKYAWDNADNPFKSVITMASAGAYVASRKIGWELLEDTIGKVTIGKGAIIGAGVGLAMSAIKNPDWNKEKIFGKWAPKETRKKWDLDEYFDRLEYMKYSGLYERAAALARRKEKVDIEGIFKQIDKNKEKINKLNIKAAKLTNKMKNTNDKYAKKLEQIEHKKQLLKEQNTMFLQGGEYTKSAVAYKKAMESTMYGLDPNATKDELLASVPDQYKDHFQAFMDITDKKEQKKTLKSVSPMMRRPLQAAWGMKLERVESNRKYFRVHAMPGVGWRGWRPNVNLKYVKMKTIENEGMLLSDFGYYESEKAKTTFEDAPDIEHYDQGSALRTAKIKGVLKGHGLHLHNVSVEKTRAPGIKVVGDVKEKVEDYKDVAGYRVSQLAYHLGTLF